jgi:hypothetical protein
MRLRGFRFVVLNVVLLAASSQRVVFADSPELAMRDFSSGQIKKGVRSIGFGGDGATWGNYGLVWKDAATALVDYGNTSYSNGNDFHFAALGATSPSLWHKLAVYLIAMREDTNEVHFNLKSPGLGSGNRSFASSGASGSRRQRRRRAGVYRRPRLVRRLCRAARGRWGGVPSRLDVGVGTQHRPR